MIGDALTTRLELTLDLRLEFLSAHLDGVHASTAQGEDEAPSIHPRDLRPLPREIWPRLYQWIAAASRSSRANSSGEIADGTTSSGSSLVIVDTVSRPFMPFEPEPLLAGYKLSRSFAHEARPGGSDTLELPPRVRVHCPGPEITRAAQVVRRETLMPEISCLFLSTVSYTVL